MSSESKSNTNSITRRHFLTRLSRASGGAAAYRAMVAMGLLGTTTACANRFGLDGAGEFDDLNPQGGKHDGAKVVILGAGIAGLTAAYELRRAGYRCEVFEARERPGGRSNTVRGGDVVREIDSEQICTFDRGKELYFNMGPARIPYHHRGVLNYCQQFGVELEAFTNDNRGAWFHNRNALGGKPVRGRTVHSDMRGHIAELLSKAVNKGALNEELNADDRERLLLMLKDYGDLNDAHRYNGSKRSGYVGAVHDGRGHKKLLRPHRLSALLKTEFWEYKLNFGHSTDQTATMLQPVGGMDKIAAALAARTKSVIHTGRVVTAIRKRDNGVRVLYREPDGSARAYDADYAIVTIPASVLRGIDNDLSPPYRSVIASVVYAKAAKVAFQSPRFWERDEHIYGGISWTDMDITQVWYPTGGFHDRVGIIGGAYIWDDEPAQAFADLSPRQRLALAVQQGEQIHPQYRAQVRRGISRSWIKTEHSLGSWRDSETPVLLQQPDDRIYFAGEHVNNLSGWQEGSVISAQDAVEKLHRRVSAGG